MQYTVFFFQLLNVENFHKFFGDIYFLIFAKNVDRGAVLTSALNLCFGAKIRIRGIPLHTPFKKVD